MVDRGLTGGFWLLSGSKWPKTVEKQPFLPKKRHFCRFSQILIGPFYPTVHRVNKLQQTRKTRFLRDPDATNRFLGVLNAKMT